MITVLISPTQIFYVLSVVALIAGLTPLGRLRYSCFLGLACIAFYVAEQLS